jgi:hypothetical protein
MTDSTDDELKAAVQAFEATDDAFQADPACIFGDESTRKRMLFGALAHRRKSWERARPCMYKGCGKTSKLRSHAIHRAGPIEQIAEQQHVLVPAVGHGGVMTMERVGVREASTFPGFCETHEQLFSSFETVGQITDGHQTVLQAFRTLCREIARKRTDVENGESLLAEFREARFDYFKDAILKTTPGVQVQGVNYHGIGVEEFTTSLLAEGKSDLKELEELYDELFQYVDAGYPDPCVQALQIPLEIPSIAFGPRCSPLSECWKRTSGSVPVRYPSPKEHDPHIHERGRSALRCDIAVHKEDAIWLWRAQRDGELDGARLGPLVHSTIGLGGHSVVSKEADPRFHTERGLQHWH